MPNHKNDIDPARDPRFSKAALTNERRIRKRQNRWNQFSRVLSDIDANTLKGPILDFGCGIGHFVVEGLKRGHDVWGVDSQESKIQRYHHLLSLLGNKNQWSDRVLIGDGCDLPFASERFSSVCSWYVLEHIRSPGGVLREMVRVLRPGGVLVVKAEDARNDWEGHYKIPWIPFLSGSLRNAWLDVFDKKHDPDLNLVEVTQPQVEAILRHLNCTIIEKAPEPEIGMDAHWILQTEQQVRSAAARTKEMLDAGKWRPRANSLFIYAVKNNHGMP